jgi:hypothetical protein
MTLALVHLVRRQNGPQALRAFLHAYERHPAGIEHQLVLAIKGFANDAESCAAVEPARRFRPEVLVLPDDGFDLLAYLRAAKRIAHDCCCLLNSFSRPLVDGWLASLASALEQPGVGLAGATGSWASQLDYLRYQLGLSSAYARMFEDREATRQGFLELARDRDPTLRDRGRLAAQLLSSVMLVRHARGFTRFPAPHLRTNALAVRRDLLLAMHTPRIRTKLDAYRLESGRSSVTARVLLSGLRAVVVGRDGVSYDVERWPESMTLWQGDQQNLLVADNRTEDYQRAPADYRVLLARLAWGEHARPG